MSEKTSWLLLWDTKKEKKFISKIGTSIEAKDIDESPEERRRRFLESYRWGISKRVN